MKYNNICVICMRGGSRGIKNKNLLKINKKDLMSYTINQAKKSKIFSKIIISSDSKKILYKAKKYKLDHYILRAKKLANNKISKIPAIINAVKISEKKFNTKFDYIFDLDATSPLRKVSDIINAFKKITKQKKENLISVSEARRNPYFNMVEYNKKGQLKLCKKHKHHITSRQMAPKVYDMNASIYIWKRNYLFIKKKSIDSSTSIYFMPQKRSYDIDNKTDLEIVKKMFLIN